MENKILKSAIRNGSIVCRKCGHQIPFNIRFKPAIKELFDKKNRKETWVWIFIIAMITQLISQLISDYILHYLIK